LTGQEEDTDTLDENELDDEITSKATKQQASPSEIKEQRENEQKPEIINTLRFTSETNDRPEVGIMAGGFLGSIIGGNGSMLNYDTTTKQLKFHNTIIFNQEQTGASLIYGLQKGEHFINSLAIKLKEIAPRENTAINSYVKNLEKIGHSDTAKNGKEALALITHFPAAQNIKIGKTTTLEQTMQYAVHLVKQCLQSMENATPAEIVAASYLSVQNLSFGSTLIHQQIGLFVGQILGGCFGATSLPEQLFNQIANGEKHKNKILE